MRSSWAGVALLLVASVALAEPRFAAREGMTCAHCHVNRTGGGMRTPYGNLFAQTRLATFAKPSLFDPSFGGRAAVGANVRLDSITTLAARTELRGTVRTSEASNSFEMREANLYVRADLVPDILTVYVDETIGPEGAANREAFVKVESMPLNGYLKAGRFLLPYGLRLLDDQAFIRRETGFTYANPDLGIEVGIAPHPFSLSIAASNGSMGGSDPDLFKQITVSADVVWSWGRAGASFAWNDTSADDFDLQTFTAGGHLGVGLGRFVALAEIDWIRGIGDAGTNDQLSLYAAMHFEVLRGLRVLFSFEADDPLVSLANNERDRFVMGLSWFPIQFLEVRAHYRLNRDIPQRVGNNADEVVVELHGFL